MTFENKVANGEIVHTKQVVLLRQCFQLHLIVIHTFIEIYISPKIVFQRHAVNLLYVVMGINIKALESNIFQHFVTLAYALTLSHIQQIYSRQL